MFNLVTYNQFELKAELIELFLGLKTDYISAIVERIVKDIDDIVHVVRFPGLKTTAAGEREIQKSLGEALLKYQRYKNEMLFKRAHEYIKKYY